MNAANTPSMLEYNCMHPPLISAIVLNYRSPQHTVRCVRALLNQSIADRMEIVVVDNHSRDDSIGVLQNQLGRFPQVRLLEAPRNTGFGKGYNLGIRRARGTYLLINNPVKILAPESVERMASAMESDPTIGVLGPKLIYADGTIREFYQIGLSPNKTGISIYILGIADKKYLAETYAGTLGKATVTGYCIRFKTLKDINTDVLEAAVRFGFEKK